MEIDKDLYKEIKEYCDLNKLKTRDFIHQILRDAFMKEKYGDRPLVRRVISDEKPAEIMAPFTRVIENPKEEVISVPFVRFTDDVTAETYTNYTSATTAVYENKEMPAECYDKINIEPTKNNKPRKRKL